MPKDTTNFEALKGWAVIKINTDENYLKWAVKQVTAEGRKVVVYNTNKLLGYAMDPSSFKDLKSEPRQLAEYIHEVINREESTVTEDDAYKAINDFYVTLTEVEKAKPAEQKNPDGLLIHRLHTGNKTLVINHKG